MPSYQHEALVSMFRNSSRLAPGLLQLLQIELPAYSDVRYDSANLTDLKPAEYRADLVMQLVKQTDPALGIIVEVQLSVDEEKQYTWPAYVANLRARIRCPVCLLVITSEDGVANWAEKVIELGGGSRIVPCVAGPRSVPPVTDPRRAKDDIELTVLSSQMHAKDADIRVVESSVEAALMATNTIDAERAKMYREFIVASLPNAALRELTKMNQVVREYMSDFARQHVAEGMVKGRIEGHAEGRAERRAEVILTILRGRLGSLTTADEARVVNACSEGREFTAEAMLAATTVDEVLAAQ